MEKKKSTEEPNLLPKEQRILEYYAQGLKKYACSKLAGYRMNSISAYARKTMQVVKKYVSQASADAIADRSGGDEASWWRGLMWMERRAKARRDLKAMGTVLTLWGKKRGWLLGKDIEGEVGAAIIVRMAEESKKKAKEPAKKAGQVVRLAAED